MRISINLIVSLLMLLFFILRTHGIVGYFPSLWAVPLLMVILFSVLSLKNVQLSGLRYLLKESKWIMLSIVILVINILLGRGNFKLELTTFYLLISLPFYIIGFVWGVKGKDYYFNKTIIGYFVFTSLFLLSLILQVDNVFGISEKTLGVHFYVSDTTNRYNDLVLFWPFAAFVSLLGFATLWNSGYGLRRNFFAATLLMIYIVSFILSGMAAPIFLFLTTILIYFSLKSKGNFGRIIPITFYSLFGIVIIYILGSGIIGSIGRATSKTSGILLLIDSGFKFDKSILNLITSDRWTAGVYSVHQFFERPLFGHGAYLESTSGMLGNKEMYTTAAGNHSYVLDTMAYYGIFGIPLIMILFKFLSNAYRYYKFIGEKDKYIPLLYTSLMVSVLVSNIINTTFLFSSFDNFVFLCSGFFLGKYWIIQNA